MPLVASAAWIGTADAYVVFFSLPSAELAGPVLPRCGVLYTCAPGGQAATALGPAEPSQVLLDGQWPECQDDARPLLLPYHQHSAQEDQLAQSEDCSHPTEPARKLHQEQLQGLLGRSPGRQSAFPEKPQSQPDLGCSFPILASGQQTPAQCD